MSGIKSLLLQTSDLISDGINRKYIFTNILFDFRWQGPLSIAVYAPGTDFEKALDSILYFRFL